MKQTSSNQTTYRMMLKRHLKYLRMHRVLYLFGALKTRLEFEEPWKYSGKLTLSVFDTRLPTIMHAWPAWWHPLTWLMFIFFYCFGWLIGLLVGGLPAIYEVYQELYQVFFKKHQIW